MSVHHSFHHSPLLAIFRMTPLHIYGDGQQTRDFTYISDMVEANIRAATRDSVSRSIARNYKGNKAV